MTKTCTDDRIGRHISRLTRIFRTAASKHEAHRQARPVLHDMACDNSLLTAVLERHLRSPTALGRKHYPVVTLGVELNPYYGLDLNCWLPLPGHQTNISTKAIHHHGNLLLTTATAFGPGYEHWLFESPRVIDPGRELYSLRLIERTRHHLHQVAFVDSYIAHLPVYPASLTITLALWSNKNPTTWKDRVKRVPLLKKNEKVLRRLLVLTRLAGAFEVKVVEYFDFYPVKEGFRGVKDRTEFPLGPNADYLVSLFHILQQTGNEHLARLVQDHLDNGVSLENRPLIEELLRDCAEGRPIGCRLSDGHFGVPGANFTTEEIEQALAAAQEAQPCSAG